MSRSPSRCLPRHPLRLFRTLAALGVLSMVPTHLTAAGPAPDADIKQQQDLVDLAGVEQVSLSPNGKMAAGMTGLYDNPGPGSGAFSLVKIWATREMKLLHEFRVPGKVYAVTFSPDGSTVLAADRTGNLGATTTIRTWNLAEGTERKVGTCCGEISDYCFSPDGSGFAAVIRLGFFGMAMLRETKGACVGQIKVWPLDGQGNALSIDIAHPLGADVAPWPPTALKGVEEKKQFEAAFRNALPTKLRFDPKGHRLITETEAGVRKVYDLKKGAAQAPAPVAFDRIRRKHTTNPKK